VKDQGKSRGEAAGARAEQTWAYGSARAMRYTVVQTGKVIWHGKEMALLQWEQAQGEQKTSSDGQALLVLLRRK